MKMLIDKLEETNFGSTIKSKNTFTSDDRLNKGSVLLHDKNYLPIISKLG